jgi:hypothetical protein
MSMLMVILRERIALDGYIFLPTDFAAIYA